MVAVLALAGLIWSGGGWLRVPPQARWLLLALLGVAVLALHAGLPAGHPLRTATGGSAVTWFGLGGVALVVLAYRRGLAALRSRAVPPGAAAGAVPGPAAFRDAELDRYARHIMLREIGGTGQRALKNARVLVVGAGGLGSPVILYLAAAGVGTVGFIDDDVVENSNLQRQVIHTDARIGMPKVFSAEAQARAQNPFVTLRPYNRRLLPDMADALFADYDLILDGSDDSATRYLVNRTAVARGLPLVSGAISQWEGQVGLFHPAGGGGCYRCLFPASAAPGLAPTCAEAGVAGPLPGVIGSMMAVEAVKVLTGAGTPLRGRLLIYDALHAETRIINHRRRPDCPDCGTL